MDMIKLPVALMVLCLLTACESLQSAPVEKISELPVITVGATPPADKDYVVFIPSGTSIPVELNVDGNLLEKTASATSHLTLARDLYIYQYWASHDGKNWQQSHDLLDVEIGGGFDVTGVSAHIKLDAKSRIKK